MKIYLSVIEIFLEMLDFLRYTNCYSMQWVFHLI